MMLRTLGSSGIKITPIIFGGWQAGKSMWIGIDDQSSIAAIRAAFDSGITTFDTAEAYGKGHSEAILGQALGEKRDQITILTKVFPSNARHNDVITACERSLKNLGTDYIDLYQIHWPTGRFNTPRVPIEETMTALNSLKASGKIRGIGVSNFSKAELVDATEFGGIESLQPPYSLFWRKVEIDLMPYCVEKNISIIAYSPLAQGLLTGKFGRGHVFPEGDNRRDNKLFSGENLDRAVDAVDLLRPIADKYNVTVGQIALAWLIAQPMTSAIVGARTPEQASENAKAADFDLDPHDIDYIDQIGRTVTDHFTDESGMWTWA